jgi:hypothetical protein
VIVLLLAASGEQQGCGDSSCRAGEFHRCLFLDAGRWDPDLRRGIGTAGLRQLHDTYEAVYGGAPRQPSPALGPGSAARHQIAVIMVPASRHTTPHACSLRPPPARLAMLSRVLWSSAILVACSWSMAVCRILTSCSCRAFQDADLLLCLLHEALKLVEALLDREALGHNNPDRRNGSAGSRRRSKDHRVRRMPVRQVDAQAKPLCELGPFLYRTIPTQPQEGSRSDTGKLGDLLGAGPDAGAPVHSRRTSLMPFAASEMPPSRSSSPVQCSNPFQPSPNTRAITAAQNTKKATSVTRILGSMLVPCFGAWRRSGIRPQGTRVAARGRPAA